jgi:hypothetical protein
MMNSGRFTRREVVGRGLLVIPALALMPSVARAAGACADPTDSLRASLHYVEQFTDATKTCSACGFFDAGDAKGCGSCKIFNGPANPKGHCDSWSAKS